MVNEKILLCASFSVLLPGKAGRDSLIAYFFSGETDVLCYPVLSALSIHSQLNTHNRSGCPNRDTEVFMQLPVQFPRGSTGQEIGMF